jgi:hypothetical protein
MHTQGDFRQIEAVLINFSTQGLSFFSHRPLLPGTTIIVRASTESYQHVSTDAECLLRSMGMATIKWCRQNTRQGQVIHEMGAAYVIPF